MTTASTETAPSRARTLTRVRTLTPPHRGQFGANHQVVEVIEPGEWALADPFILLMDDRIDGMPQLGPHPHAGFETVTFSVEGTMPSEGGGGTLEPGDLEWSTAGSGMVHGPERAAAMRLRILQLWLKLPSALRWTEPDHQFVRRDEALVHEANGARVHVYSGRLRAGEHELVSSTRNRTPTTIADIELAPGATLDAEVPSDQRVFFYPLGGTTTIDEQHLIVGQVGWSDPARGTLHIANRTSEPARVLLYAGVPQHTPLISHGPFIGESLDDIRRAIKGYQAGGFARY
jgi:hypothetical protein